MALVAGTNAGAGEDAVVVHLVHTDATVGAVVRLWWLWALATVAKGTLFKHVALRCVRDEQYVVGGVSACLLSWLVGGWLAVVQSKPLAAGTGVQVPVAPSPTLPSTQQR